MADHLSCLDKDAIKGEIVLISERFPDEQLLALQGDPWYTDIANHLAKKIERLGMIWQQRMRFLSQMKDYYWEDNYLFCECVDHIIRRCIMD